MADKKEICRFCADNINGDCLYIFDSTNKQSLFKTINKILPINISIMDALPKQICRECYNQILTYQEFLDKILKTEKTLKQLWNEAHINKTKGKDCVGCPLCFKGEMVVIEGKIVLDSTANSMKKSQADIKKENQPLAQVDNDCLLQMINIEINSCNVEHAQDWCNYSCFNCEEGFMKKEEIENHQCYTGEEEEAVVLPCHVDEQSLCETCGKKFKTDKKLKQHISFCHPVVYHVCNVCHKEYAKSSLLSNHMRKHTGERPFSCPKCPKSFPTKVHLWNHNNIHHKEHMLKCHLCESTFCVKQHLDNHIRSKHTKERKFECSVCKKSFMSSSVYYQHRMIHSNVRKYSCSYCPLSFRRWQTLNNHTRTHTGERPFLCDVCGRGFRQRWDMKKHRATQHCNVAQMEPSSIDLAAMKQEIV